MASLNNCQFIGNVGKIESRFMTNGDQVVNLSIACNESWKDKNTGEKQERTEWINVVIYRKLAEIADQYVKKGQQLYIAGRMTTRKWQDKSGNDRYTTEIIAREMNILGGSNKDDSIRRREQERDSENPFSDDTNIPF